MSSWLNIVVVVLLAAAATQETASVTVLGLERTLPLTGIRLEQLKILDRKHLSMKTNVVEYSLGGTSVLYYTGVKLGTPPKEYTLQFDTGSDLVWVSCTPCTGCPASTNPNIKLENYNPDSSSTSSRISCSDKMCAHALETGYAVCQTSEYPNKQCSYAETYADGTAASGYYVSDTFYFDKYVGQKRVTSSASIFFGCSNSRSYQFQTDGIIGFGQNAISAISQLNSQGVSSKVFSHCLRGLKDGSKDGGGILVVGEVKWTGLVFTPIIPSQDHYNVNMKGIAVNGKNISIDSSWLTTSNAQGTIVDSGTTLVYLADGAYDPVITAINDVAHAGSINSFIMNGSQCYYKNISNVSLFPTVTLYFDGGASMTMGPKDYLVPMFHYDGLQDKDPMLCIGFQPSKGLDNFFQHTTILGDIVLHDKIFMYNLETKQIGWVHYNCSHLNTSTPLVGANVTSYNPPVISESFRHRAPPYCNGLIALAAAFIHIL
ncbi:unnamed protein product [Triticum turgidum subsp. durum]|uniref:Peptidase A1 domain-containing protein n=1 Tax=Triticum turgidum subsp. durum TaxID=4567 RepID=A0A9R1AU17_TRITD|nr:unnamed protein product [Triticum turgidum subsp. durum]